MTYPHFYVRTRDRTWATGVGNSAAGEGLLRQGAAEGMDLELVQVIETVVKRSKDIDPSELAPPPGYG